jgi:hypothetical protein
MDERARSSSRPGFFVPGRLGISATSFRRTHGRGNSKAIRMFKCFSRRRSPLSIFAFLGFVAACTNYKAASIDGGGSGGISGSIDGGGGEAMETGGRGGLGGSSGVGGERGVGGGNGGGGTASAGNGGERGSGGSGSGGSGVGGSGAGGSGAGGSGAGGTCSSPSIQCTSGCVDPTLDAQNCGACGVACPSGTQTCTASHCRLLDGQACTTDGACTSGVCSPFYVDADRDTYGTNAIVKLCGVGPPAGYATRNGDCCDSNAAINPAATFQPTIGSCDGVTTWDYDCSGHVETNPQTCSSCTAAPACACVVADFPADTCGTTAVVNECGPGTSASLCHGGSGPVMPLCK